MSVRSTIARLTMRFRAVGFVLFGAATIAFAAGLPRVELKTVFSDLLPRTHPFVQTYKDHPNFGNPLTVTIMVKRRDGDIYNAETLTKVWDLTRAVDLTPAVDHDQILSISTEKARFAEATPTGIDTRPLMEDHPPATAEEIEEFKRRVQKSPNIRRFMVSRDQTATLITATFIEHNLDYGKTFDYLQDLVEKARDARHDVYMAGQPALTGWVYHHEGQMIAIFAVTGLALLLALLLYMRNLAGIVTPLVSSVVAAIWGFGFVGWMGYPIEPLIMVVPLLLMARSFSHCVQFTERYYEILHHTGDRRKAAELSLNVMLAPSVLGIVTDTAGLFLIAVAPIPAMERFALFCGFWAMMLVPTGVFLAPLILSVLPKPRNIDAIIGVKRSIAHYLIRSLLHLVARLSVGRTAWLTTFLFVVATAYATEQMLRIQVGNSVEGTNLLWPDSEYNVAVSRVNRNFPGLNTLEVVFEAKDAAGDARVAREAETIVTMNRLQYALERGADPPAATLSFADYLPEANRLFSGGNPKWAPLDPTDAAMSAATSALMFGTSPKAFLNVTDFEQRNATVSLWFKDNKQETVDAALADANAALKAIGTEFEHFRIRLGTGTIALQQSINDTIIRYQWVMLALLNAVMWITCSIAYRSGVAGLLLLVPVNMANVFLGAAMSLIGIGLDVNSLPIMAIGLGVGIDYGIYLLSRICEEYRQHRDERAAIIASVTTTGKAIFFTATIVLIGITPWYYLSELKFLADMGLMLVMVMLINMVLSLIIVPLLVWIFRPQFVRSGELLVGESVDLSAFEHGAPAPVAAAASSKSSSVHAARALHADSLE